MLRASAIFIDYMGISLRIEGLTGAVTQPTACSRNLVDGVNLPGRCCLPSIQESVIAHIANLSPSVAIHGHRVTLPPISAAFGRGDNARLPVLAIPVRVLQLALEKRVITYIWDTLSVHNHGIPFPRLSFEIDCAGHP